MCFGVVGVIGFTVDVSVMVVITKAENLDEAQYEILRDLVHEETDVPHADIFRIQAGGIRNAEGHYPASPADRLAALKILARCFTNYNMKLRKPSAGDRDHKKSVAAAINNDNWNRYVGRKLRPLREWSRDMWTVAKSHSSSLSLALAIIVVPSAIIFILLLGQGSQPMPLSMSKASAAFL